MLKNLKVTLPLVVIVGGLFSGVGFFSFLQNGETLVGNIDAFASVIVNDLLPNADYGMAFNSIKSTGTGFFDVLDDDSDSSYVKSASTSFTSGSFGVAYGCLGVCPNGVVTDVKIRVRNVRSINAGTGANFNIELKRTDGLVLGSVTGIPFSGTAPTIGSYETTFAVNPALSVSAGQLATVITWSKAVAGSGSEVRFHRARLDATVADSGGGSDTIAPTVTINSPANGAIFTQVGNVIIEAVANDNVGIARVEFWLDGAMQSIDYSSTNPHAYIWPVTGTDNGSHTWTVKAFDTAFPQLSAEATIAIPIDIPFVPPPPLGPINFMKATNLDTILPFPDVPQIYRDVCARTVSLTTQYDAFPAPPATYGTSLLCDHGSDMVYESQLDILADPINAPGRGKVVKHYPLPDYPAFAPGHTYFEHHGFIFTSNNSAPVCSIGKDCWYGGLYYFPQAVPAGATHNLDILGAQGTASGGYLATLTKQGKIRLYNDCSQCGIPIAYNTWLSVRVYAPAGDNTTRRLIVTGLDGGPVVAGQSIENIRLYTKGVGTVTRVKFGTGGELDAFDPLLYRNVGFWWYQDNMYVADQVADPGVWKE